MRPRPDYQRTNLKVETYICRINAGGTRDNGRIGNTWPGEQ